MLKTTINLKTFYIHVKIYYIQDQRKANQYLEKYYINLKIINLNKN